MDFGDFCEIEQKRYGVPNEFYTYKVVGAGLANYYMPVPVRSGNVKRFADICDVVKVICCGVCEETVETFRLQDVYPKVTNVEPKNLRSDKDWYIMIARLNERLEVMDANESYLNQHLAEVDASDRAQDWKDDYIAELLAKGGDCYPYTHAAVLEALENRKTSDELFLTSCIIAGCEAENPVGAMGFIGLAVKKIVYEYWKEIAEVKADIAYNAHYQDRKYD